jgi:hypothetical protein
MNARTSAQTPAGPGGIGLLVLGLLSLLFGPVKAVPGLILSRRFRPFTATTSVGYFLCWLFEYAGWIGRAQPAQRDWIHIFQYTNQPLYNQS